jgi:hypothetical protein
MNSRRRFLETMHYGSPDRVPYFEEGIREEVLSVWRAQGMPPDRGPADLFPTDERVEIEVNLEPYPSLKKWPGSMDELTDFRLRLDSDDPKRLPEDWSGMVRELNSGQACRMLQVHDGFFLTMGVYGWERFAEVMYLVMDDPDFVREAMSLHGRFAARMAARVLGEVDIEAAVFSEPIGGNDRPLISPAMYETLVLSSYEPLLNVLRQHGVEIIIFRTYANARLLIPSILKWGFNCLWACEVNTEEMDYRDLRQEFGRDLCLIGGIDLDALRQGRKAIRREVEDKVPPLLRSGGYVPLADGRIREDVPYDHYRYYRELLARVVEG